MEFKGHNLHTYTKQHGILIKCNIQVQSTKNYNVNKNIVNTIFINYGSSHKSFHRIKTLFEYEVNNHFLEFYYTLNTFRFMRKSVTKAHAIVCNSQFK